MSSAETIAGSATAAALATRLGEILAPLESVAVAFSGGVDSAVVLRAAVLALGTRALAVTARSASFAPEEMEIAERTAREIGAAHRWIETDEVTLRGYRENPLERCFFCKTELYRKMRALAEAEGIAAIADGVNADDALGHDRPGLVAAERQRVVSPLLLAGMRKSDVRAVARLYGLSVAEKPAMACLSSRIPFGETITPEKLAQVGAAEGALRRLGFEGARVRHHGAVARIELPPERIDDALAPEDRAAVIAGVKAAGFAYVALDLEGYRAGSMHEVLQIRPLARRATGQA
jgi:uncharacterized protein